MRLLYNTLTNITLAYKLEKYISLIFHYDFLMKAFQNF